MLYIIYAESLNYCGYGDHWLVEALSEDDAIFKASGYIEEYFYEQDEEQLQEDYGSEAEHMGYADIKTVETCDETHEMWPFRHECFQV